MNINIFSFRNSKIFDLFYYDEYAKIKRIILFILFKICSQLSLLIRKITFLKYYINAILSSFSKHERNPKRLNYEIMLIITIHMMSLSTDFFKYKKCLFS